MRCRHVDCTDLFAGALVIGAQHRAARVLVGRRDFGVAEDNERFRDEQADAAALAGLLDVKTAQRRVIAHLIGCIAVRYLPQ